ncbi:MAG: hypothetical protein M3O70_08040 [Actinomycetota bacterium]|nr:hypothetical protein [Actinomycetota bacterium]
MAKRCGAPYRPGRRTRDWIKTKHTVDSDLVIVGVDERPERRAYLVAREQGDGPLAYEGRVEFVDPQVRRDLAPSLKLLRQSYRVAYAPGAMGQSRYSRHRTRACVGAGLREARIVALAPLNSSPSTACRPARLPAQSSNLCWAARAAHYRTRLESMGWGEGLEDKLTRRSRGGVWTPRCGPSADGWPTCHSAGSSTREHSAASHSLPSLGADIDQEVGVLRTRLLARQAVNQA